MINPIKYFIPLDRLFGKILKFFKSTLFPSQTTLFPTETTFVKFPVRSVFTSIFLLSEHCVDILNTIEDEFI